MIKSDQGLLKPDAIEASHTSIIRRDYRWFWQNEDFKKTTSYGSAKELFQSQYEFREKASRQLQTNDSLYEIINNASLDRLQQYMKSYLDEATLGMQTHHANTQVITQVGRRTALFARTFSRYLEAYSGIIEVMKGADQQFGGLAYNTLSLLFVVAVNKHRYEDSIDKALLTLQQEFSRMVELENIHATSDVSADVSIYYGRSSWRRLLHVIGKPPEVELNDRLSEITAVMGELDRECRFLDSKRLKQVQDAIHKVQNTTSALEASIEDIRNQKDIRSVDELIGLFNMTTFDPEKALRCYHDELEDGFKNLKRWRKFDMSLLETHPRYQKWVTFEKSSILYVYGRTKAHKADFCWLSPSILHLVEYSATNNRPCAYHCCHEKLMEPDIPISTVLASLIVQLLRYSRKLGRDRTRYNEFYFAIDQANKHPNKIAGYMSVLRALLMENNDCLLLLDRVDRIKGDTYRWLKELRPLMQDSKLKFKVLLVAELKGDPRSNFFEWMDDDFGEQFEAIQLDN